jgi:hypothetical protein
MGGIHGLEFGEQLLGFGCIVVLKEVTLVDLAQLHGQLTLRLGKDGKSLCECRWQLWLLHSAVVVVSAVAGSIFVEEGALIALVASALEVELTDRFEAGLVGIFGLFGAFLFGCHDGD